MRHIGIMFGSYIILLGGGGALAIVALLFLSWSRSRSSQRRRQRSIERGNRNRAWQKAWDMVFGPRPLRLQDHRGAPSEAQPGDQ
jgi:FtsZ-interacting cell division protein ZipA